MEFFGDGSVGRTKARLHVAQAEIAFPNRLDVRLRFFLVSRLDVDALIRPELVADLKDGARMLVPRRCDPTDGSSFQFRRITDDNAFGFPESLRQFVIRCFETAGVPLGLQADERKQT